MDAAADRRWIEEARAVYRRYEIEIVEACGLCPWAERARLEERLRVDVLLQTDPEEIETSVAAIATIADDPKVEVALLVYPRLDLGRRDFEHFAGQVRSLDTNRRPLGEAPFVFAVFHPDAEPDTTTPERLIPYLRRTPDPSIQLLRSAIVDDARISGAAQGTRLVDAATFDFEAMTAPQPPPLRERIARANMASVQRIGLGELTRRLEDIRNERNARYARLLAEEAQRATVPGA